jgi:MinD superfamily P-loop ATPase
MIVSIASGKGGTGKTIIATSMALSIDREVQFIDCDVEEPNAHIFLKPVIRETKKVYIPVPKIDLKKCDYCGKCQEVCAYNAIAVMPPANGKEGNVLVFPDLCHGCGSCSYFCPKEAIHEVPKEIGVLETGFSGDIRFVHARLNIGEVMAPPLIREEMKQIVSGLTVIIDAPPGTSCPVIESVKESDFCILVTEPTPFGLNDLVLSVEVLRKLSLPFGVVINRSDLGDSKTETFCKREKIPVLMKIPFRREIAEAYSKGSPLVQAFPEYKKDFQMLLDKCRPHKKTIQDREEVLD